MKQYTSFRHWFSYHWGWILGGIAVSAFLLYAFLPGGGSKPDYVLSWIGTTALSETEEAAVKSAAARAGADQNGDGMIEVSLTQFIIDFHMTADDSRYEENYGYVSKMLGQLQTNECYLYLLEDPERFQYATGALQYLDGARASEADHFESSRWEEMCVPWNPEGLAHTAFLARRAFFGQEDPDSLFPGGNALFDALSGT